MSLPNSNTQAEDLAFMKETLALAEMARGWTGPDPMVAALVVKHGKVISRGYHDTYTMPHAEAYALSKAGRRARGSTLYVNLEPCCHWGNNPPCTGQIIHAGVRRVVAATRDPNPLVAGKGIQALRRAGIEVIVGVRRDEAMAQHEVFMKHIASGRPFVTMKAAMSLDGKMATDTGESKWITGLPARQYGWHLRAWSDAVLVGSETVIRDDPELTCHHLLVKKPRLSSAHPERMRVRRVPAQDPLRIVVDSRFRVPLTAKIFRSPERAMLVTTRRAPKKKIDRLRRLGAEVLVVPMQGGHVHLGKLMALLGKERIASLLIEGGGTLHAAALRAGIVDKAYLFYAPKFIGGIDAPTAVEGARSWPLGKSRSLSRLRWRFFDPDFMVSGYVQ